ncbi:Os11g0225566 [Oryza sativa Japonica Group]|uniref:Os11g0225566 protein n=1 Tax=Oryza sativa subsp. japonica TaxID=39947 RepID=A0A0P0Y0V5_ORYSJ|nr:Os11g0225566 [Oryza sativa Japonica Group]
MQLCFVGEHIGELRLRFVHANQISARRRNLAVRSEHAVRARARARGAAVTKLVPFVALAGLPHQSPELRDPGEPRARLLRLGETVNLHTANLVAANGSGLAVVAAAAHRKHGVDAVLDVVGEVTHLIHPVSCPVAWGIYHGLLHEGGTDFF